jgi:D-2-hydroxyacid dehydrogenase (NADP+)
MTNPSIPTVLVCASIMGRDLSPIRALEPSIRLIDGNEVFEAYNKARSAPDEASKRAALDVLLGQADVLCMSFPMLRDVMAPSKRLRWLHHTQAGVSNLWTSDVWAAEGVTITSGRGYVRPTAMAEYCIAGAMSFARAVHDGELDRANARFDRSHYKPKRIEGSTMGVVGLGGIGKEVARLSKALGMRVIATRRSAESRQENVDNADVLLPAADLAQLFAESDFVSICTQLTRETTHLINRDMFNATTRPIVIANVSRGEVIDEDALLEAIAAGQVRGALLDVYEGELAGKPPRPELWDASQVVLTPHISTGGTTSDDSFMRLFVDNLQRYLKGEELLNVVDRERGY